MVEGGPGEISNSSRSSILSLLDPFEEAESAFGVPCGARDPCDLRNFEPIPQTTLPSPEKMMKFKFAKQNDEIERVGGQGATSAKGHAKYSANYKDSGKRVSEQGGFFLTGREDRTGSSLEVVRAGRDLPYRSLQF